MAIFSALTILTNLINFPRKISLNKVALTDVFRKIKEGLLEAQKQNTFGLKTGFTGCNCSSASRKL
jgi:hypothetical protein